MTYRYREKFTRAARARELAAAGSLLAHKLDFTKVRPMVGFVGDYIADCIRSEGLYERQVLEVLRRHVINSQTAAKQTAIDIGANIGNHSLFFSGLFQRVISFEPNPIVRSVLEMNIQLNGVNNIDVLPFALADSSGSARLAFDLKNLGGGALREPSREPNEAWQSVHVELARGDDIIDQLRPIGLIKIDVEGAEEGVLKGLEKTIRHHSPIIMLEQWPTVIEANSGSSPSFNFLMDLGYLASEIRIGGRFRGRTGKLLSVLLGYQDYFFEPVTSLYPREYPALVFIPVDAGPARQ